MIEAFLFLFTGIIGFVTLGLMLRFYRSNPFCNLFLVIIISIVSFRYFIHGSYILGLQSVLKPDKGLFSLLFLIIAPCLYLYYKHLTLQKKEYSPNDLKHGVFIIILYLINSIDAIHNSVLFYFGPMTNFFLIGIFLAFYNVLIFNLLSKEVWFRSNLHLVKDHFNLIKNWTITFFIINVLCSIVVLFSLYNEFNSGVLVSGKSMVSFLLIFWVIIFFKILISPEILYGLPVLNKTLLKFNKSEFKNLELVVNSNDIWILETSDVKNNQDQKLQEKIREHILSYIHEVEKLSNEEFIFRNQKTSQGDIAEKLGVPTSHIVYLFKYHSKISFSEFRMNSRIHDAIVLLENGFLNSETFDSLAHTTGFSSYNPFFLAFKKNTSYSPQEYMKNKNT